MRSVRILPFVRPLGTQRITRAALVPWLLTQALGQSSGQSNWIDFEDVSAARLSGSPAAIDDTYEKDMVAADLDLDGDLDLVALNGRVRRDPSPGAERRAWQAAADVSEHLAPYAEPNLLFANDGGGSFRDASALGGPLTSAIEISRGLLAGDLDGDGDLDLVTTAIGGRARVLRNDAPRAGRWLRLRVIDPALSRDALGANVIVRTDRGAALRPAISAVGYLTAVEPELHFGLGPAERVERISVTWPGGARESFPGGPADRLLRLRKGEGTPE